MNDTQHTPTPWELWKCGNEWMLASVRHGKLMVLQATRDGMQGATLRVRDHKTCTMHKVTEADVAGHPDLLFLLQAVNSYDALLAALEAAREELMEIPDWPDLEHQHELKARIDAAIPQVRHVVS